MSSTTAPRAASTSFAPSPLPTSSAPHTTSTHEPELPYPSPSIESISGFPRINTGCTPDSSPDDSEFDVPAYPYPNSNQGHIPVSSPKSRRSEDAFAAQRGGAGTENNPFTFEAKDRKIDDHGDGDVGEERPERACGKTERKMSGESDTPKSPSTPSRHQNSRGSALTTPRSRESHIEKDHGNDSEHHTTFVEKGWARMTGKRSSRSEKE